MSPKTFMFSRGDVVKRLPRRTDDDKSPLDRYLILGNFKTTRTGAHRCVVEPIAIPGLYLIQAEASLNKTSFPFISWLRPDHSLGFTEEEMDILNKKPYASKHTGSYDATGRIIGFFEGRDGSRQYVFEFDSPSGLLHIFRDDQITIRFTIR